MGDEHNEGVEELASEFDSPFNEVFADHTDRFPDPAPINGRIPDIVVDNGLGRDVIEVDTERSDHEQEQIEDIRDGLGPLDTFDRMVLEDLHDDWPSRW
jgi:hypothetical protein